MEDNLFYQVYDDLYREKDYADEARFVKETAHRLLGHIPARILEIGCGTGSHTLELAKAEIPITAIDINPNMVFRCRQKLSAAGVTHVKVLDTPVEKLEDGQFDLVISLFNVVTYLESFKDLCSFFHGVYRVLSDGGVFLFDAWNGIAALLDPPQPKKMHVVTSEHSISCILVPETDFFHQKTRLTYTIQRTDLRSGRVEKDNYSFAQTLWTPNQLQDALIQSGFRQYSASALFAPDTPATERDWKIMFVAQK